ncbi:MAG: hypothetical protein R2939_22415 [Kofleriaceae bacterium]
MWIEVGLLAESRRRWSVCGIVAALTLALMGGCVAPVATETCADGAVCPSPKVCAPTGACVEAARVEACEGLADGTMCELGGGLGAGECRRGVCELAGCGNGQVDSGEACDDGNDVDDDGCSNACTLPRCGDQIVQAGEACDDGAGNGNDRACTSTCEVAVCGDGLLQAGVEACDLGAGNLDTGTCTTSCEAARCGDGLVWEGVEACDDGNEASGDGCRGDCGKVEVCGDAAVDAGEACDDGNGNAADGCDACTQTAWQAEALLGQEVSATLVGLSAPLSVAVDRDGNLFIADTNNHRIRRVASGTGVVTTVAGTGVFGFSGDGGAATSAQLKSPSGVAVDGAGNLYIADTENHRIRRVAAGTGVITTVAGTGIEAYSGDGGPAASARLARPRSVATDGAGNVFIADTFNRRVRRVAAGTGVITTVVGTGVAGFSGDGGAATGAQLSFVASVAVDGAGNLYIADTFNHRIRRVVSGTGVITTVAGTGAAGFSGDGGAATSATLASAFGVAVDGDGNLLIADTANHRIRRVEGGTGVISTVAGTGSQGFSGDGGTATSAQLKEPAAVAVDGTGNLYIADTANHRVRRLATGTAVISTVAGTGVDGFSGDGGVATSVQLAYPDGVSVDAAGNLYIADTEHHRIRRVESATSVISTVAGTGSVGFSGDGGLATDAQLALPTGVAVDGAGDLFIADSFNHRIRRVAAGTGVITTVAGTGVLGFGDGGAATSARLARPHGVAVDAAGDLFIADTSNSRIRRVASGTGVITTVAGTGVFGFSGDGGAATSAQLASQWRLRWTGPATSTSPTRRTTASGGWRRGPGSSRRWRGRGSSASRGMAGRPPARSWPVPGASPWTGPAISTSPTGAPFASGRWRPEPA